MLTREFCAENMELVPAAVAAGAAPSYGVIRAAVALAGERGVGVMCMIRPRGGGFEYTPDEAAMMRDDLAMAKRLGVTGVVFGCLRDGHLDRALTSELVELADGVDVTFHMAFDALPADEQLGAIDWLAGQGVSRILTHGGPAGTPIEDNLGRLRAYVDRAAGRVTILPGGGITWENAERIASELGVCEVHGTKIVRLA